ncbi:MAG: hypothetical protein WCJ95_17125 [Mariniphaga sp.]
MNFNDLSWHDAAIKNINIDRANPGINDSIQFDVIWPNGHKCKLVFEEVYMAQFSLNFGIVCTENILSAYLLEKDNKVLTDFYLQWRGLLTVELQCYVINLNSTGGEIKIISRGFKVIKTK